MNVLRTALLVSCLSPQVQAQCADAHLNGVPGQGLVSPTIDDGVLFVGSPGVPSTPGGTALGFEATGTNWSQVHTLTGSLANGFGRSCSLKGDVLLVSSTEWTSGTNWGAAYFFTRVGATWVEEARVTAPLSSTTFLGFGSSVAVDGDTAVVGAPREPYWGALYVFERGPWGWARTARLVAMNPTSTNEELGSRVAIDGDRILASALASNQFGPSACYVFERSGTNWTQAAKLQQPYHALSDFLGSGVDIVGDRAYVGAYGDSLTVTYGGAVLVYEDGPSGWMEIQRIEHPTPTFNGFFGFSVAANDEHMLVGVPHPSGGNPGSAFLYSTADWLLEATLQGNDSSEWFGHTVDLSEEHAVVGAPAAEYIYVHKYVVSDRFCEALPNSTGKPALLHALGCSDTLANNFELLATPVPAGQPGMFFFGPGETSLPFGDGRRCVTGGVADIHRLPPASADASGDLALDVDFAAVSAIAPGSTWKFQALYRDPAAQGAGFNLSDGLSVTFQ